MPKDGLTFGEATIERTVVVLDGKAGAGGNRTAVTGQRRDITKDAIVDNKIVQVSILFARDGLSLERLGEQYKLSDIKNALLLVLMFHYYARNNPTNILGRRWTK